MKRGDVALGHCMRKLLHLVFAVWKTDRPFNGEHFPWANPDAAKPAAAHQRPLQAFPPRTRTRRPWATRGTCPQEKWSPRPPPA